MMVLFKYNNQRYVYKIESIRNGRVYLTCGTYLQISECKKISQVKFWIYNKAGLVKTVF